MATIKLSTTIAGIVAGATGATGPTGPAGATGASGATTTISNGTSNLNILASGGAIYANTAGTNAITVDTSQRVGIGTVSPSDKFEVVGTTNREYARVESTFSSSGSEAGIRLKTAGTNGREWLIFNGNTEGSLRFYDLTGSAERMRIQSTGKVGIGNSSPDAQNLHVGSGAGGGSINGYTRLAIEASDYAVTTIKAPAANFSQIIFADPTSSNLGGINFFNSTNATPNAMAFLTGGGTERMRITSAGATQIKSTTGATPTYSFTNNGEGLLFRYNDDTGVRAADIVAIGNTPAGAAMNMRFWTNNTGTDAAAERMRITSGGSVGIGTTSPSNPLVVSGGSNTLSGIVLQTTAGGGNNWGFRPGYPSVSNGTFTIMNETAGTVAMSIASDNRIGMGAATGGAGNTLKVFGIGSDNAVQFGNASNGVYLPYASPTSWSSYSDSRLKDVIGDYENALDHILHLNPVKYTFKSDANKKVNIGLLAQNVLEVIPEIVDENTLPDDSVDKTKYLALRYTDLIPVLIGAIQELKAINDTQAETIKQLQDDVATLKGNV